MRTKTLLLTAALTAAGVAASMAQVYSVNVVGYVNITVQGGQLAILANPLNNGANSMDVVLPLPTTADGTTIFRFDPTKQKYMDSYTFYGTDPVGWYSATDPTPTLVPGEGFWIKAPPGVTLNLTFVGEVPQGSFTTPAIMGNGRLSLVGSQVPQENNLGDTAQVGTMNFPAANNDTVYVWDLANQKYKDSYTYYADAPAGWYSASDDNPAGPKIPVGFGFWVKKDSSNGPLPWTRTFVVQ